MSELRKLQTIEVRKGLKTLRENWDYIVATPNITMDKLMWFHEQIMLDNQLTLAEYSINFIYGGHSRRPLKKEKTPQVTQQRIGFGSQSRVGKDSVAAHLVNKHGGVTLSFAKPIYDIMYDVQERLSFPKQKDPEFLQTFGQWACKHDPNIWINKLLSQLDTIPANTNVYVTDVRKKEEAEALRSKGFKLVKIVRPDRVVDRNPRHITETDLEDTDIWDDVIINDGTLEELYAKVSASSVFAPLLPEVCSSWDPFWRHADNMPDPGKPMLYI